MSDPSSRSDVVTEYCSRQQIQLSTYAVLEAKLMAFQIYDEGDAVWTSGDWIFALSYARGVEWPATDVYQGALVNQDLQSPEVSL